MLFFENLWEAVSDALLDTLKLLPFLFLTYLLMEFFEHKAGSKSEAAIKKAGRFGPLFGGLLGAAPQCGFSAAASGLYAGRIITRGTLIAVFLSTSDEMLPIMLSGLYSGSVTVYQLLALLGSKIVGGIAIGFLVDLILPRRDDGGTPVEDFCEHEGCNCGHDGIWLSSLKHTVKISLFILTATAVINLAVIYIGEDRLGSVMHSVPVLGEMLAALVGLIPNCASSVIITELYIGGAITAGQMLAGLFTGAGVGVLILFRTNRNLKEDLLLTGVLYVSGVALGLLFGETGLASLIGL